MKRMKFKSIIYLKKKQSWMIKYLKPLKNIIEELFN